MPAPKGNDNAEKFTRDDAISSLEQCILSLNSGAHATLQHALRAHKISSGLKNYWKKERFKDDAVVLDAIKRLEFEAEDSLWIAGADQSIPANLCMFGLKAMHGWVEKGVELGASRNIPLVKVVSVKADGTRVER